jgi:hypothetical protein
MPWLSRYWYWTIDRFFIACIALTIVQNPELMSDTSGVMDNPGSIGKVIFDERNVRQPVIIFQRTFQRKIEIAGSVAVRIAPCLDT